MTGQVILGKNYNIASRVLVAAQAVPKPEAA